MTSMMINERLKQSGRLRQFELDAARHRTKIKGLVRSMRETLDPFEPAEKLDLDVLVNQALEASTAQIELKEAIENIRAIKEALGE